MARKRKRLAAPAANASGDRPTREEWRRVWVEGSRGWSAAARAIAATAPLEEVGGLILGLARLGRLSPPSGDDDHLLDRLFERTRQIDREAFEVYDRLGPATPKRLRDRRAHALRLALDEYICADDSAIAATLHGLEETTWH